MADNKPIDQKSIPGRMDDSLGCRLYNHINGLYYYYLEPNLYNTENIDNTSILGTSEGIANVAYAPFVNLTNNELNVVPYDTERFGTITGQEKPPNVFRIVPIEDTAKPMKLIEMNLYDGLSSIPSHTTKRDILNTETEGKLQLFPYRTIIFSSNVFDRYEVIPHMVSPTDKTENKVSINAIAPVTPGGNFYVTVPGYKETKRSTLDVMERSYTSTSMDIPNSSSAYSNYMSSQKARASTNISNSMLSAVGNMAVAGAGMGAVSGSVIPGAGTAVGAGAGALFGAAVGGITSVFNGIKSNMAAEKDMITTPNSLKSTGGDILTRIADTGKAIVYASDLQITDQYKVMLSDFFHMYGYKMNMMMNVQAQLRTRKRFNYIKTVGCNVKGTGVPKKHLAEIKAIFDKGITLWHVDKVNEMYEYSYENPEENIPK